jgi:hypothetical protein
VGPHHSSEIARIEIPSVLFNLEKHEIFPYERFAYNALKIGVELLADVNLTTNITIDFNESPDEPWLMNAAIRPERTLGGAISAFCISTTPLTPQFLLAICRSLGNGFAEAESLERWLRDPAEFRTMMDDLGRAIGESAKVAISADLATAVRRLTDRIGLTLNNIHESISYYDAVTHFIVGHEVAHAYVGQLNRTTRRLSKQEYRAFEFIVDLLAARWTYMKFVGFTPDSQEYRESRGFADHSEAIHANSQMVVEAQLIMLAFMAISGAINSRSSVSLDGGDLHPHGCVRFLIQNVHLLTLIFANQGQHFSESQMRQLHVFSTAILTMFAESGLVPTEDMMALADPKHFLDVNVAASLIEEFKIRELRQSEDFLADLRAMSSKRGPATDLSA